MRPSRFNVIVPVATGGQVLFNTLRGSLTRISVDEVISVATAFDEPDNAPLEVTAVLSAQGHLIEDDVDELAIVTNRRVKGIADRARLDVVVMPTLDCNFDCHYCYETHTHGQRMTPMTEQSLIRWLEREIPSARLVLLHFFGGEPLLDTDLIARVTNACHRASDSHRTVLAVNITTNGYLLNGKRRDLILQAGIRDFQITLDGPARTHDLMRPLAGGRPSHARVFANIVATLEADARVFITLRVNVNHTNIDAVEELLVQFPNHVRSRLRLVLEPIFGGDAVAATKNIAPELLSARLADLYRAGADLGYEVSASSSSLTPGRSTYCYAERDRQVVVAPSGSVFKCAAGSFDEQDRLGTLTPEGSIATEAPWDSWMERGNAFPQHCQRCVYLPLCMGGCRKVQVQEPGAACTLVPSNAAYVLKQIALTGIPHALLEKAH